jgi:ribosomal protein S27E
VCKNIYEINNKKMKNNMVYMKVKCENCGNNWDYQGKSKWYLACPKCKNTININELTEKDRIR